MADPSRPTVRRIRLGRELRRLREARGWTLATAAHKLRRNFSSIGKVERGEQGLTHAELLHMLDTYELPPGDLRQALIALRHDAHKRGWWLDYRGRIAPTLLDYISLENDAGSIYGFDALHLPGLLQTEAYARAIIRAAVPAPSVERVDELVAVRMTRQEILHTAGSPLLWAIVDEAVLRRLTGDRAVMRAQLHHLLNAAQLASVNLKVLPYTAGAHPALASGFTFMEIGELGTLPIVMIESITRSWYLEDDEDIHRYRQIFERLDDMALSEADSRALIQHVMSEL